MPKISDEKRAARRTQILEAAWVCFQKQGLHTTTMDDIIRASGLSAGAVYSYYPSKEELIVAAVTTSLGGLSARLEPLLRAAPPPDRFVRGIAEAIDQFTAREGYDLKRIALLGWSEAQRNQRLRTIMEASYRAFRDGLTGLAVQWKKAGLLPAGASEQNVAKLVLAAILGYVVQSAILGDVQPEDLARGLREIGGEGAGDDY